MKQHGKSRKQSLGKTRRTAKKKKCSHFLHVLLLHGSDPMKKRSAFLSPSRFQHVSPCRPKSHPSDNIWRQAKLGFKCQAGHQMFFLILPPNKLLAKQIFLTCKNAKAGLRAIATQQEAFPRQMKICGSLSHSSHTSQGGLGDKRSCSSHAIDRRPERGGKKRAGGSHLWGGGAHLLANRVEDALAARS